MLQSYLKKKKFLLTEHKINTLWLLSTKKQKIKITKLFNFSADYLTSSPPCAGAQMACLRHGKDK